MEKRVPLRWVFGEEATVEEGRRKRVGGRGLRKRVPLKRVSAEEGSVEEGLRKRVCGRRSAEEGLRKRVRGRGFLRKRASAEEGPRRLRSSLAVLFVQLHQELVGAAQLAVMPLSLAC